MTAMWSVPHEVEQFTYFHMAWDVAKAWRLIAEQETTEHIGVEQVASAMFGAPSAVAMLDKTRIYAMSVGVDTDWCLANEPDLTRPVLLVTRPLSSGESVTVLIDGYHRLWRAWHDGVETLPAVLLTEEQERAVRLR